jgi:hypothetical protein
MRRDERVATTVLVGEHLAGLLGIESGRVAAGEKGDRLKEKMNHVKRNQKKNHFTKYPVRSRKLEWQRKS